MRKPKLPSVGFEVINLEDSLEDDFECLDSSLLDDGATSTLNNSSSDDDWSVVDDDALVGDVISATSSSTTHDAENCVGQHGANSRSGADSSKERLANLMASTDLGQAVDASTPTDAWVSICDPLRQGLESREILFSVDDDNFATSGRNSLLVGDDEPLLNEARGSGESNPCANLIFQKDSGRELLLECVEIYGGDAGNEMKNKDNPLGESVFLNDGPCLFPYVEMSDSDSDQGTEISEEDENIFEKDMFFSDDLETSEFEFSVDKATPGAAEGPGMCLVDVDGPKQRDNIRGGQTKPRDDQSINDDQCYDETESPDDCFDASEGICCEWSDGDDLLPDLKWSVAENFLPTNDLYDFFPSRYCPQKFDRYGSRLRKKQMRGIIRANWLAKKLYSHY